MKKTLLLATGLFLFAGCTDSQTPSVDSEISSPLPSSSVETSQSITSSSLPMVSVEASTEKTTVLNLAEIKKHNTPKDCWGVVDGKVYDVTSFFGKHPAGDKNLAKFCGKEATDIFKSAHGEKIKAMITLKQFYKGDFVK